LKDGVERVCDGCGKIYKDIYFPYKSVNYCINCYEKKHGIVLHTYRKSIGVNYSSVIFPVVRKIIKEKDILNRGNSCPTCYSNNFEKKGFRNGRQRYICKDCGRNWTSTEISSKGLFEGIKKHDFERENTLKDIITYLKKQEIAKDPLIFWYRDDVTPRNVYDYHIDEKYVNVRSSKGFFMRFLIDKIRKI